MNKIRDSYQEVSSLYFDIVLSGINYENVTVYRDGANFTIEGVEYTIETDVENDKINVSCIKDNFNVDYDSEVYWELFYKAIDAIKLDMHRDLIAVFRTVTTRSREHDYFPFHSQYGHKLLKVEKNPKQECDGVLTRFWNI